MRRRRNPRGGRVAVGVLSDFQRAYLLTGVAFEFLRGEGDGLVPFRSVAVAREAWGVHRASLLAEMGETGKPWGAVAFGGIENSELGMVNEGRGGVSHGKQVQPSLVPREAVPVLLADAEARRDRPVFPDAIQRGDWKIEEDFLWDVREHQWHSEYGRPAWEHPRYGDACDLAAGIGNDKAGTASPRSSGGKAGTASPPRTSAGGSPCFSFDPVWIRTWSDVEAVLGGCWFDVEKAEHAVAFFKLLRHSKGKFAGRPFVLLPWQKFDVIMPLFGWQRLTEDGRAVRRFTHAYIEIPKKNGKSTLAAGISLYLLVADGEQGAEIYNVAAAIDQAKIVFKEALRMARACPYFKGRLTYRESLKNIEYRRGNSEYVVISSDAATSEGKNISGLIFDELHAQKDRDLFDALVYGGEAREQPLFASITTAGKYDPLSIGWEQHEYARRVLAGEPGPGEDTSFFGYIRGVSEEVSTTEGTEVHGKEGKAESWLEPYWWYRSNPGLGVTLDFEKFAQGVAVAREVASKQNSFKRYRLNIWVHAAEAAFDLAEWGECLWDGRAVA